MASLRSLTQVAILVTTTLSCGSAADRIPFEVRENVMQRVVEGDCVGIVVGVVDAQGTAYFSRGRLSRDGDRPVGEDTIFEIGSITKAFTAVLLADMVERNLAALDDPVQKYLPLSARVPSRGDKSITLRDLATHRSGLPRLPADFDPKDPENPYADYTEERLLQLLAGHELSRDIGATYEYSNLGAGLLGYALSRRAGTSFEQLVIDRISEPLGLKDTRITLSEEQRARLAQGHVAGKQAKNWDIDALAGAGALRSTARDLLRFLSANLGLADTPLSKALQATHRDRFPTGQPDLSIALGWHVWTKYGTTIIWHNGGTGGYHSFCGFIPQKGLGVVVLTNSNVDIDDIGLHVLESQFALKAVRKTTTVQGALLDEYSDYYELQPGVVLHISREGHQLFAQLTGQAKYPVYPESDTQFFFKVVDAQLTFVRGGDGKVAHLVLHQNGDHKAKKLTDYQPPVHVDVPVDAAILAQYVGKYELTPGVQFDVVLESGQLKIGLADQPRFLIYPESETQFFYKGVEAQITFVRDASGKVTGLILHEQGGLDQSATKVD